MIEKKKAGRKKKTTHSSGLYRKRITLGHDSKTGEPIVKAVYGKTKDELEELLNEYSDDSNLYPNGRDYDAEAWD